MDRRSVWQREDMEGHKLSFFIKNCNFDAAKEVLAPYSIRGLVAPSSAAGANSYGEIQSRLHAQLFSNIVARAATETELLTRVLVLMKVHFQLSLTIFL